MKLILYEKKRVPVFGLLVINLWTFLTSCKISTEGRLWPFFEADTALTFFVVISVRIAESGEPRLEKNSIEEISLITDYSLSEENSTFCQLRM